jgi:ATP-dependent exoDNAse (exonuclease V) beta subunit
MKIRVASAGTGKTASLVLRYLDLIAGGVPLRRIAGVTFTRKAADELRGRVGSAIEEVLVKGKHLDYSIAPAERVHFVEARLELGGATLSTIHGFMGHCLRLTAPLLHLDPDFGLMGDWEAKTLFEEEWQSLLYLASDPSHELFGLAHVGLTEPLLYLFDKRSLAEAFDPGPDSENQILVQVYQSVFSAFQTRLGSKLLSPSEVERRAIELIHNPRALERVRERYQMLLVDEFQDVNPLQGRFFSALRDAGLAIEAVGDPKQSIYAFRDADVEVFRRALKEGEQQEPLDVTYRHASTLVRFLNRLSAGFAEAGLGFDAGEAPAVRGVRQEVGRLEVHWTVGESPMEELRRHEAQVLAGRLRQLLRRYQPAQLAVLVRSRSSFAVLEEALLREALPYVLLQGRGYYERQEIRDLYHALRVGVGASGLSLAAWLRSPFAQLGLEEVERVLASDSPERSIEALFPELWERLLCIRQQVRRVAPLEALKFLVREPMLAGKSYPDFLDSRARENVDALLFQMASRPPRDIEILLERLQLLSRQAEAGDVPQSGEGIQLLTVHGAKGLEWPVVAVFDLGRMQMHRTQPLYLGEGGRIALPDTEGFAEFREQAKAKESEESYRLLYVGASRARDVLLLSGSVKQGKPTGWAEALSQIGFGPEAVAYERSDYVQQTYAYRYVPEYEPTHQNKTVEIPPWLDQTFAPNPYPPLFSPSALKKEEAAPLPLPDLEEGEEVPGRARAVGTLVHYAIGQNWNLAEQEQKDNLEAQEVMFPFDPSERDSIMAEVGELLASYERLKGSALPWPRDEDYPEYPLVLPLSHTVWQGVIDRLYRVGQEWYLEDYKTDLEVDPQRYHLQLALYREAIHRAWNIEPQVRLVYLRFGELHEIGEGELRAALDEVIKP